VAALGDRRRQLGIVRFVEMLAATAILAARLQAE
jgi:hypothetical protein